MPITRTPIIDDDGTGTTGTAIDNAWKQEFYDQIDVATTGAAAPGLVNIVNSGDNAFDVVLPSPKSFYYVNVNAGSAEITLRSMTAGANHGDQVLIQNSGYLPVRIQNQTGPLAQFLNRVTSGLTPIARGGSARYVWIGIWFLAEHDQGKAIRVPYNAANYLSNAGSWTVPAGNIRAHDYFLNGNALTINLVLENTTISGSPTALYIRGWPLTFMYNTTVSAYAWNSGWIVAKMSCDATPQLAFSNSNDAVLPSSTFYQVHGHLTVEVV